ncbi:ATP-binding protein [Winogradskyella aurantia]|uniref:histidine kinase n=1 Tax=Winogradskyella aurantia TaxID=1915063 RepID=A0A265UUQ2_9FLAO|nr:ATP-binding protein [Winogradskyella aurantia]OZV69038.1 hypothetical protein CA834_06130 [Winogradskyella aurantia]
MEAAKRKLLEKTHQTILKVGFEDNDYELVADLCSPSFVGFGTALDEKVFGIKDLKALLKRQKEQSKGFDMNVALSTLHMHLSENENTAVYIDEGVLSITTGEEPIEMILRLSLVLEHIEDKWLMVHFHSSKPEEVESEKDTWGIENWKEKAEALEKEVAERTADLVLKNRDLEIEAALERVRAQSMAMHSSDELNQVVAVLFENLKELQIPVTAAGIQVYLEDSEDMLNYVCGENSEGLVISHYRMPYFDNAIINDFKDARDKKDGFFVGNYSKKIKDSFYTYLFENTDIKDVPEDIKQMIFDSPAYTISMAPVSNSLIAINDFKGNELSENHSVIIKRFAKVFEQAYIRFRDLQKAEAQAREAQIEAALEKVRSRSMAMHNSQELKEVALELRKQMGLLGQKDLEVCAIHLYGNDEDSFESWSAMKAMGSENEIVQTQAHFPKRGIRIVDEMVHHYTIGTKDYILVNEGEKIAEWFKVLKKHAPELHSSILDSIGKVPVKQLKANWAVADFSGGSLVMVTYGEPDEVSRNLLRRSANVFEQAHVRFLDLQMAEAQAREAQIQLCLERVRAKSMAMQSSNELETIIQVVHDQFVHLGITLDHAGFIIDYKTNDDMIIWLADEHKVTPQIRLSYFDSPHWNSFITAKEKGHKLFVNHLDFKTKNKFYKQIFKYVPELSEDARSFYLKIPSLTIATSLIDTIGLYIENFSGVQYGEEDQKILLRFGEEFQQAYTRFLDLKKAEAQTREAQIEAALEKVRSRTMAMQKSEELPLAANNLFLQVQELGIPAWSAGYCIWEDDSKTSASCNMSSEGEIQKGFVLPSIGEGYDFYTPQEKGESFYVKELGGEALVKHYDFMKELPNVGEILKELTDAGLELPTFQIFHICYFKFGYVMFITYEQVQEAHSIFQRFGKVFEQTYTRFLDLKRAEEQARESKIEASLERVRSQSMGMQSTNDFAEVTTEMFNQLRSFGEDLFATGIVFCDKHEAHVEQWHSIPGGGMLSPMIVPIDLDYIHQYRYDQWKAGKDLFSIEIPSDFIEQHFEDIFKLPSAQIALKDLEARNAPMPAPPPWEIDYGASFKNGYILISSLKHLENTDILPRFAKVFEQAYTRFLDLQTAEKNAYKSKVETALERVRARALAMQEPEELKEVASVLRTEMGLLGIEELETSSIYILDDEVSNAECWYALKDARSKKKKLISDHISMDFTATWVGQQMLKFHDSKKQTTSIVMKGKERIEWIRYCAEQSEVLQSYYGEDIPERTYHLHKFSNGAIGAASAGDISEESWVLLKRCASVFSLAYSRFKDLTQAKIDLKRLKTEKKRAEDALSELQTTQKQLIQSEKMASLGELTAGIAHEIQNPLNFVNNFSEVSKELLEEMKEEIENGDLEEAKEIMQDIIQNLEKINHHGKRADGIVKGMLQHSRASGDKKEPTDINALADEYLRLAYHGLRAKDQSFNAELVTDFDDNIETVKVVPQDVGRVILNLLTNAFYVVNEKKKTGIEDYKPSVSISTKKKSKGIQIIVTDNGNGMPESVKEKIFQPFFTTKPTGEGTGLGLSLSYDIITKGHGGDLKVETKENVGTIFTIQLPEV